MRYVLGALLGTAVGVLILAILMQAGLIQIGIWAGSQGQEMIFPILVLSTWAGVLLVSETEVRKMVVVPVLLFVVVITVLVVGPRLARKEWDKADLEPDLQKGAAERAARSAYGIGIQNVVRVDLRRGCNGVRVLASGSTGLAWFWYDIPSGRITDILTEEQLRTSVQAELGGTTQVTDMRPVAADGGAFFTYRTGGESQQGDVAFGPECGMQHILLYMASGSRIEFELPVHSN